MNVTHLCATIDKMADADGRVVISASVLRGVFEKIAELSSATGSIEALDLASACVSTKDGFDRLKRVLGKYQDVLQRLEREWTFELMVDGKPRGAA